MIWSIDGIEWDVPCDISRVSEVTLSEISGMLLDKSYFGDVVGTYLKYTVKMVVPLTMLDEYTEIYEALTEPVDGHTFVMPYNQSTVTITGRILSVSDVYVMMQDGSSYWKGILFEIIANHPTKTTELSEVIARGASPLPQVVDLPDGTVATKTSGGWDFATYEDADEKYY